MNGLVAEKKVTLLPTQEGVLRGRIADMNDLSEHLDRSYHELENRIGQLQVQLAQSNQQRLQEFDAREKLAERLDLVLGVMPVAVILLDGRGSVAQANGMAESLLGCKLVGMRWIDVIQQCFAPAPANGHEVMLRNGKLISLATQSMNNEPGQIIVLSDQTETRKLQDNLNHHRKLSEMGRMTASLAHQIRTPLSSAILFAGHLTNPLLSEEKRAHYAERIRSQLNQLDQQVRDILIFSKGGVVLDQTVSSTQLATRLIHQLEDICAANKAGFQVINALRPGQVRCNPELLVSAFNNLVENAIQAARHNHQQHPYLTLILRNPNGAVLECVLEDNGPGIPAGLEEKILEPFFTTKSTGTGLGLAVVNAIIQSHGGSFVIANREPVGASASITLPVQQQN